LTIFQKPRQVAIALRDGTLAERAKLNFLWILIAITGIFGQDSALRALRTLSSGYGLILLVPWGILVWGVIASYRANRQGDNQNFIERFICLTASLSIRAYLAYAVLVNLILFLSRLIYASQLSVFQFLATQLVVIGMTLYIYLRLKSLMLIAADPNSARDIPASEP
jgi:FtsH-binding integral membrane protein